MKRRTFLGVLPSLAYGLARDFKREIYETMNRIYKEAGDMWVDRIDKDTPYFSLYEDVDGDAKNGFEEVLIVNYKQERFEIRITDYKDGGKNKAKFANQTKTITFYPDKNKIETKCKEGYVETVLENILKEMRKMKT